MMMHFDFFCCANGQLIQYVRFADIHGSQVHSNPRFHPKILVLTNM